MMMTYRASSMPSGLTLSWSPALEECARGVFQIMLGSSFQPEPQSVPAVFSLTAVVGFAGQKCGLLTLRCDHASGLAIAARMLGVQPALAEPEMNDALGELSNMIAGSFKAKLEQNGLRCMISVPTVISGSDYQLHNIADGSLTQLAGRFDGGTIDISLQLQH
jgi:chemotaxis protein CheX